MWARIKREADALYSAVTKGVFGDVVKPTPLYLSYVQPWWNGLKNSAPDVIIVQPGKNPPGATTPSGALIVDGLFGPDTIRTMQRFYGTPVDGVISKPSLAVKAMQEWIVSQGQGAPTPQPKPVAPSKG